MKRPPPARASTVPAHIAALAGVRAGKLHDPGAKADPFRQSGEKRERRHGIGTVRLRAPDRIVAKFLGPLHQLHRDIEMRFGIAD